MRLTRRGWIGASAALTGISVAAGTRAEPGGAAADFPVGAFQVRSAGGPGLRSRPGRAPRLRPWRTAGLGPSGHDVGRHRHGWIHRGARAWLGGRGSAHPGRFESLFPDRVDQQIVHRPDHSGARRPGRDRRRRAHGALSAGYTASRRADHHSPSAEPHVRSAGRRGGVSAHSGREAVVRLRAGFTILLQQPWLQAARPADRARHRHAPPRRRDPVCAKQDGAGGHGRHDLAGAPGGVRRRLLAPRQHRRFDAAWRALGIRRLERGGRSAGVDRRHQRSDGRLSAVPDTRRTRRRWTGSPGRRRPTLCSAGHRRGRIRSGARAMLAVSP